MAEAIQNQSAGTKYFTSPAETCDKDSMFDLGGVFLKEKCSMTSKAQEVNKKTVPVLSFLEHHCVYKEMQIESGIQSKTFTEGPG